jgi:pre-rRNA-processing protein IPI1
LEAGSRLTLDCEADIRQLAVKLLSAVLTAVTDEQIAPSFEIVTRYLACAMSHINSAVRETSLSVLDVLITKSPKLTATHCQVLPTSIYFTVIDIKLNIFFILFRL